MSGHASATSMSGLSPQPTKLAKAPLKTLLEEQCVREMKPLLREPSEEVGIRNIIYCSVSDVGMNCMHGL